MQNRAAWRQLVRYIDPQVEVEKNAMKEEGTVCISHCRLDAVIVDNALR